MIKNLFTTYINNVKFLEKNIIYLYLYISLRIWIYIHLIIPWYYWLDFARIYEFQNGCVIEMLQRICDVFHHHPNLYSKLSLHILTWTKINLKNSKIGDDLLRCAVCHNGIYCFKLVCFLLKHQVESSHIDSYGETYLHKLCIISNLDNVKDVIKFIKLLIRNGVDANQQNNNGATALINFCRNPVITHKHHDILIELMCISDVTLKDIRGNTAYDYFIINRRSIPILDNQELHSLQHGTTHNIKSARSI